jgi:hypothetical protein
MLNQRRRQVYSTNTYIERARRRRNLYLGIAAALFVVLILGVGACATSFYKDQQVTLKVTGKESVNTHDGHQYRIYSDTEVYVMEDSLFKGRFRTANDYAALQQGHTYTCEAFGWRVPLFSTFKNLHDCQEVR